MREQHKKESPILSMLGFGGGGTGTAFGGVSSPGFEASGGTKIIDGGFTYHVFLTPGNFVVTSPNITFDVLGIACGGGVCSAGRIA